MLVEVKNQHNTVKKDTLGSLYEEFEHIVMPKASTFKGFTIYYVTIIPEKPLQFNKPFTP
ncbi:MAG TPA: hypothetical protein DDY13_14550 [Cytophagales bacterium]|nr:hypothetical protein [Cytophagales bacterium]